MTGAFLNVTHALRKPASAKGLGCRPITGSRGARRLRLLQCGATALVANANGFTIQEDGLKRLEPPLTL